LCCEYPNISRSASFAVTKLDEISHAIGGIEASVKALHEKHDRAEERSLDSRRAMHTKLDDLTTRVANGEHRTAALEGEMTTGVRPVIERVRRREYVAIGMAILLTPIGTLVGAVFGERIKGWFGL